MKHHSIKAARSHAICVHLQNIAGWHSVSLQVLQAVTLQGCLSISCAAFQHQANSTPAAGCQSYCSSLTCHQSTQRGTAQSKLLFKVYARLQECLSISCRAPVSHERHISPSVEVCPFISCRAPEHHISVLLQYA